MSNQDKALLEVNQSDTVNRTTVSIRTDLKKRVHALAMRVHRNNPRTWNFHDTLEEIIERGSKAILADLANSTGDNVRK